MLSDCDIKSSTSPAIGRTTPSPLFMIARLVLGLVGLSHTSVSDLTPPSCDGAYKQEKQSESEREREARDKTEHLQQVMSLIH
jgi:hypothetical protein